MLVSQFQIKVMEKDNHLVTLLKKKFNKKLTIINDDILKIDENKLWKDKLIVFGNLPYNISTEILCRWILNLDNNKIWFSSLILMFQKEVADRIISKINSSADISEIFLLKGITKTISRGHLENKCIFSFNLDVLSILAANTSRYPVPSWFFLHVCVFFRRTSGIWSIIKG